MVDRDPVGETRPALVEKDQSRERGEPSKNRAYSGTSQLTSMFEIQPGTQMRSNGPSPTTW